jgi:biotin carboxylase
VHVGPLATDEKDLLQQAQILADHGPFTHVIAGTEASVVAASLARRVLKARLSPHTVAIRCHDKLWMKRHLSRSGIPMTPFLGGKDDLSPAHIADTLGFPVVTKPRRLSGGRGIHLIADIAQLAKESRRDRLLERFVDAPEISVESFVNERRVLFESVTEYFRKGQVNIIPAELPSETREAVLDLNHRVLSAMNISWGMTHTEMYLTEEGPLVGEIALRPPGGYIMEVLKLCHGLDAWAALLAVELSQPFTFPRKQAAHAAVIVLHPGEGVVRAVSGLEEVSGDDAVVRATVRVQPGDRVAPRLGVGTDVGHVLLKAASRARLLTAIAHVDQTLQIDLG